MFTSNVLTTLPKLNCGQTKFLILSYICLKYIPIKIHHICYNFVGLLSNLSIFTSNLVKKKNELWVWLTEAFFLRLLIKNYDFFSLRVLLSALKTEIIAEVFQSVRVTFSWVVQNVSTSAEDHILVLWSQHLFSSVWRSSFNHTFLWPCPKAGSAIPRNSSRICACFLSHFISSSVSLFLYIMYHSIAQPSSFKQY